MRVFTRKTHATRRVIVVQNHTSKRKIGVLKSTVFYAAVYQ